MPFAHARYTALIATPYQKNKILYQFFSDLITDDVINDETISNIFEIQKNSQNEIITVNYNLEKTYEILTNISDILKKSVSNLENGKIDIDINDKYINQNNNGLVLNVPIFIGSKNIFINNIGPKIPVVINFNDSLLTNLKTKVTNYGFNNALLEIYVTVEMKKLIITPLDRNDNKFYYDILIGALVVNGSVPKFYDGNFENSSNILDIPMN